MAPAASMTERLLREQLEEAQETVRQLRETISPGAWVWYDGLDVSRIELVILNVLLIRNAPTKQGQFRTAIDNALGNYDAGSEKSVDISIMRLRRKLRAVDPPITINTAWGYGYWMDEENKKRLLARRRGREEPGATAKQAIQQIKEIASPGGWWIGYEGVAVTPSERVILDVLLSRPEPIDQGLLRAAVDGALAHRKEKGGKKSIDVRMVYLRRKLSAVDPPIKIKISYGKGFWIDDENKARLLARRRDMTSEVS